MNRMQSGVTIILCFMLMGAFVVSAETVMEGNSLLAVSEKNVAETPEFWPELTKETTVRIGNQTGMDLTLSVNNTDIILEKDTMVWIPCQNAGDQLYSELKTAGDDAESLFIVSECGDALQSRERNNYATKRISRSFWNNSLRFYDDRMFN